jgi:hypothetical protein
MNNNMKPIEQALYIVGLLALAALLFGLPLQFLWNQLMPSIFGLKYIGFWEACGLNLMAGILFRSNITIKKDK